MSNLVKSTIYFETSRGNLFTNKPNSLQKTGIFRSTFVRLLPKIIKYLNYISFDENIFCDDLDHTLLKGEIPKSEDPYSIFIEIFQEIIHKHAPLKPKQVRDKHLPF